MRRTRLGDPHRVKTGVTQAGGALFVFGPYRSDQTAGQTARALSKADFSVLAGSYVVWAKRTSKLEAQVQKVATCLKGRHSHGSGLAF
jgi:hypothetical protein